MSRIYAASEGLCVHEASSRTEGTKTGREELSPFQSVFFKQSVERLPAHSKLRGRAGHIAVGTIEGVADLRF